MARPERMEEATGRFRGITNQSAFKDSSATMQGEYGCGRMMRKDDPRAWDNGDGYIHCSR